MREVFVLNTYLKRESMEAVESFIQNPKTMGKTEKIEFLFTHQSAAKKNDHKKIIRRNLKEIKLLKEGIQRVKDEIPFGTPLIPELKELIAEAEIRIIQLQEELKTLLYYDIIIYTTKSIIIVPFGIDLKKDCNRIQYLLSLCGMAADDWVKRIKIAQCIGGTYIMYKDKAPQKHILKIS